METLDWTNIIVAGSLVLVGLLSWMVRPEKPNQFMGYRTRMSMLNQQTWKLSNNYMSTNMIWVILLSIASQIFGFFIISKIAALIISTCVMVLGLGIIVFLTERKLRTTFNKDGSLKRTSTLD